ncbi:unnamed protein product [Brugia pahangi]|uniref:Piwi domain-containing protein n=1 Tax=Brugia pahangi TaxID=6280 RepID=A0A0N4TDG3_BRUPA|nr:unnamed protein product [Brugia pahangi]
MFLSNLPSKSWKYCSSNCNTLLSANAIYSEFIEYFKAMLRFFGTSRPSHYTVLYDSWLLSADEWQQMIYALCHIYARCNKSVSIPAPVYYAHLACDRARRLLKYTRISEPLRSESNVHILEQSFALNPDTPNIPLCSMFQGPKIFCLNPL